MITITRTHEICAGHRVYGHEGKCKNLHGHNYTFEITARADELDPLGRVVDFSVLKRILCEWLEANWDHKMLLWDQDPMVQSLTNIKVFGDADYIVALPQNPTAENIAWMFHDRANALLARDPETCGKIIVTKVRVWETAKCCAEYAS